MDKAKQPACQGQSARRGSIALDRGLCVSGTMNLGARLLARLLSVFSRQSAGAMALRA